MAARRIRGVIEPAARPRREDTRPKPDGDLDHIGLDNIDDYYEQFEAADRAEGEQPHPRGPDASGIFMSGAYRNHLKFILLGVLLFVFLAALMPDEMTRWYVQFPVVVLLAGNALVCWAYTRDWESDSRIVGFGAPALFPAVLVLAFLFGLVRFA